MDVKTTDNEIFEITQAELDRVSKLTLFIGQATILIMSRGQAREHSVHSQSDVDIQAPSKHVYILVHISDVRREPRIRFLADPWDLFEDGQLILETTKTYQARLKLRHQQPAESAGKVDAGFDSVQIRSRVDPDQDDASPEYKKWKEREEMKEINAK